MKLSAAFIASFLATAFGRELFIEKQGGKSALIRSKDESNTLWFNFSVEDGVPTFEIKGSESSNESSAKTRVQLAMNSVNEESGRGAFVLAGTQQFWSDVEVEKQDKQIVLRAKLHHEERDISYTQFAMLLEATIDENSTEFNIRPMIQNFPYSGKADAKGLLGFEQVIGTTYKTTTTSDVEAGEVKLGPYGSLFVLAEGGYLDGTPLPVPRPVLKKAGSASGLQTTELTNLQFDQRQVRNVTFVEKLTFNVDSLKIAPPKDEVVDVKAPTGPVKGKNANDANILSGSVLFAGLSALAAIFNL